MTIRVLWGVDWAEAQKRVSTDPMRVVSYDPARTVNGHILMTGMSGSGKTHQLRRLIDQTVRTAPPAHPLRFHVFDVHDDIEIAGSSNVLFSEQTAFGINPFRVTDDPHYGGPRRQIQAFLSALNRASHAVGTRQEAVLRNLLVGLYEEHGFRQDDPNTWQATDAPDPIVKATDGRDRIYLDVPFDQKDDAKRFGAFFDRGEGGDPKGWWIGANQYTGTVTRWRPKSSQRRQPTMLDLMEYTRRMVRQRFLGTNIECVTKLELLHRAMRSFNAKRLAMVRKGLSFEEGGEARTELDRAAGAAQDAFSEYLGVAQEGGEMDALLKYDSIDVLRSVLDRIENLNATGLFRPQEPPFDPAAKVWRYRIKPLSATERQLFVPMVLRKLFNEATRRGVNELPRDYLIVDEAANYLDDDPDNELALIAREARKFGVALVCAAQSPHNFHEDFLASVGTKVVLAFDEMFWDAAVRKLKLPADGPRWLVARKNALIQSKLAGETTTWKWTTLPQDAGLEVAGAVARSTSSGRLQ